MASPETSLHHLLRQSRHPLVDHGHGRVFQYAKGRVEPEHLPPPAATCGFAALRRSHGAFWLGTDNQGVVRLVNGKATRFTVAEGLRNNGIQAFFEDRDRNLWIGTTSGLSRWDGSQLAKLLSRSRPLVRLGSRHRRRRQWRHAGGHGSRSQSVSWRRLRTDPAFAALNRDRIWSIYPRVAGHALDRHSRRRPGSRPQREDGQDHHPGRAVEQLHLSGDRRRRGSLWMSGPMGLSAASIDDLNAAADGQTDPIAVLAYGTGDGLESTQINGGVQPSGCLAPDGELWFPSVKGAVHFKPGPRRTGYRFPVRVESVLVDGKSVPAIGEVRIGPGRHRLEIEFTACSLARPGARLFSLQVGGHTIRTGTTSPSQRHVLRQSAAQASTGSGDSRDGSLDAGSSEAGISIVVRPDVLSDRLVLRVGGSLAGRRESGAFFSTRNVRPASATTCAWRNGPASRARCTTPWCKAA